MGDQIQQIIDRARAFTHGESFVELFLEWLAIFVCVWMVILFLRGTRGARALQGVILILLVPILLLTLTGESFTRLDFLLKNLLALGAIAVIVIFQPELRRAMVRLGEARLWGAGRLPGGHALHEITQAVSYLSRNKIGALMAIERHVGLSGVISSGTPLDATISAELLNTIFYPGSALHDLGVIIRGNRVVAAGVQFPLSESGTLPNEFGSRHRAGFGLSEEVDALVLIVSEETGAITVCERGTMQRFDNADALRQHLLKLFRVRPEKQLPAETEVSDDE